MTDITPESVEVVAAGDGYPIRVACWASRGPARGRAVVLHGVQSHYGWYGGLGERLAAAGYEVRMPDRRGSGHNESARGDAPDSRCLIADIAGLLKSSTERAALPTALVGISWGGKLALVTAARHPEAVQAIALVCPGLTPRVGVPFGEQLRIARDWFFRPSATHPIPLADPALFTANPAAQAAIAADPLSLRRGTARLLGASFFLDRAVDRELGRVRQPTLLMLAGHDRIVDNARTLEKFGRLGTDRTTVIEYPEAHHTLEFEPDPARYAADMIGWLDANLAKNR